MSDNNINLELQVTKYTFDMIITLMLILFAVFLIYTNIPMIKTIIAVVLGLLLYDFLKCTFLVTWLY